MKRTFNSRENTRLVRWLKSVRLEKKISAEALGAALDAPHTLVSKVERQERRLDVIEYLTYCAALDVDPSEGLMIARGKRPKFR